MVRPPVPAVLAVFLLVALSPIIPAAAGAHADRVDGDASGASNPCVGTITNAPATDTLVSIQGARGSEKTPALLASFGPDGAVRGVHNGTAAGRWWYYDVDELPNGNLLMATTEPGVSIVQEIDPVAGEIVGVFSPDAVFDMHDVDRIGTHEYAMVDMHDDHNRVLVYNRTTDEVSWAWHFNDTDQFPRAGGGPYGDDWTHVNDVDRIADGVVMVSVRNFDQVIAIDRATDEIRWTLGADDTHGVLFEQHNPDYLEAEAGTPTVLVADSRNDRVAEFALETDGWKLVWELVGGNLAAPRDADRLPNGNTLVTDRRGHRVIEVTPRGEVVWEVYTPWQPYDAERVGTGPGSTGPTMQDMAVSGRYEATGSADPTTEDLEACASFLTAIESGGPLVDDPGTLWGGHPAGTPGGESPNRTPTPGVTGTPGDESPDQPPTAGPIETPQPGIDRTTAAVGALLLLAGLTFLGVGVRRYRG